jgi:hypothetical protein
MRKWLVPTVLSLAIGGCSTADDPPAGVPESALHFLTPDSGAPGFIVDTIRFYAVAGQDRSATMYYQDSTAFVTFDVPANALANNPDGSPIADGDSIPITVAIADSARLIVGFQPAGLVFASGHPALLTLSFAHATQHLSPGNESKLSLWREEQPGDPWHKVPSNTRQDLETVTGRVDGFTVYATAY